jgi:MFS family permease
MTHLLTNLRAGLRQLEIRLIGDLPPDVRYNQYADLYAAMMFGVFVTGLNFLPVVMRRLGAPPDWLAFYAAQPFIGFMLTSFSVMLMPRQQGLMRYAATFWFLARGSFLLAAFINDWPALIALTLFFWIGESFPLPVYTRLMQAIFPAKTRGQVLSTTRVGMSLVSLLLTPLVGVVLDAAGHQWVYPFMAVAAMLSVLLFTRLRYSDTDVPPNKAESPWRVWGIVREDRRFALYLFGLTCFGLGFLAGGALYAIVQVDRLQLSYSEIGALGVVQSVFFLIGYLVLGRWIDRAGGLQTLRWVFVIGGVMPLTYALALGFAPNGWVLAPAFAALGLVNAGMDLGVLNTVMQLAKPGRLGEYSALQTTVLGLRGLVAPFLGVWLVGAGLSYEATFLLAAVLIAAGVAVVWKVSAH